MMMRRSVLILLPVLLTAPAVARESGVTPRRALQFPVPGERTAAGGIAGLSSGLFVDTVSYGGTRWAADSLRWEAIRDSCWTFETGVGSAFGPTGPNKPASYHTRMEGWTGFDATLNPLPYFRRTSQCAISGSFSLYAGVTAAEANALCYSSGPGYGNNWALVMSKSFAWPGSGALTLGYKYAVDAEPGFDYCYVTIDTTGDGSQPDVLLASYSGATSGVANISLSEGTELRSDAGPIVIKIIAASDGAYSDEDGLYPTTCGHTAVDDISLTGAISDLSTFEAGANGWSLEVPVSAVGDYTNLAPLSDLPPPVAFCPCGVSDSVLVFFDESLQHPLDQDNLAISPWIDLRRGGDAGRPGKLLMGDIYTEMPLGNYIFLQQKVRWYPSICPATGLVITSPFRDQNTVFYFGESPFCNGPGAPSLTDYSALIDQAAEQIQIAWGVLSLCRTAPFGVPCTGISNTTPWVDNLALGVYGSTTTPAVAFESFDILQDNFAADGSLNPASPGRLDTNYLKNAATPVSGSILGDTLVVGGDGGNTEVRLVFRVRPGPFTGAAALSAWASQWTPEPALGAGWYSARMDTAEQGGVKVPGLWMGTFHESDPGFAGNDRSPDPLDPSQLENEILPDHLLTPGSRVDYFVAARYRPPDPRNPGGTRWFVTPDTSGGSYNEVEILPSSMAADSSWNCTLYVDHHHDRELADQAIIEQGLKISLGPGGSNAEGTRFDRFDNQAPSSGQLSFGRPLDTNYGASSTQVFAYKNILWFTGSLDAELITSEDVAILTPWLLFRGIGDNRFYGSGDDLATSMQFSGEAAPVNFMRNIMGVLRTCNTIRSAGCPATTSLDSTYCLPLTGAAGAEFALGSPSRLRGNGCPNLRSFDVINRNSVVTGSRGNLSYVKSGVTRNYASVTNFNTVDVNFKTVFDAFQTGRLRSDPGYFNVGCSDPTAAYSRLDAVLDWFGSGLNCRRPSALVDVPDGEPGPGVPAFRVSLGPAHPNPVQAVARIPFTTAVTGGPVRLQIFDVTGRLVKTLVDEPLDAGLHEAVWDGRGDDGHRVPDGMYFYRLAAGSFLEARKLIVMN